MCVKNFQYHLYLVVPLPFVDRMRRRVFVALWARRSAREYFMCFNGSTKSTSHRALRAAHLT